MSVNLKKGRGSDDKSYQTITCFNYWTNKISKQYIVEFVANLEEEVIK